jgi:hypothetical protein
MILITKSPNTPQSHQIHHKVMILITKSSNPSQSHQVIKSITKSSNPSQSLFTSHHGQVHAYSSHVAYTWLLEWPLLSLRVGTFWCEVDPPSWPAGECKIIKCIINGKDRYIDGKNMKTDLREIYLSSRRCAKHRWWWGWGATNCDMSNPCCATIC